ncbi:hypothetical protein, unknown function [Leishmania mexicana MHOM/GT/2001/U1103]|uniref:Uncharacterized protein n=1 Tax=Leishmania mexicana (strain MHOM/GT/2001/U1103) TaxID=929439 RepID=E9B1V4_LEIMU|nr:hypothetical protein, unknown function [Leishmania mexicana MHOM/GT/2001/U1103]CBZ29211.1 hypothetical protein, unknown function [Leishmania mexicana MHOM/GT/2001/U1103]
MSMWKVSPVDGVDGGDCHNYNAFAWQQLFSNLGLDGNSVPTNGDEVNTTPGSCSSPMIGLKESNASAKDTAPSVKADAHHTSSFDCSPTVLQDYGYSSEDGRESPADQVGSGRSTTPFYSLPTTTATAKSGSGSCIVSTQNSSDATAPCFFINGVRHSIESPCKTPDWTVVPGSSSAPARKVSVESLPWASTHIGPSPNPAKPVVAGNNSGVPCAWLCAEQSATQSQSSTSLPLYAKPLTPPAGYAIPVSPPSSGMGGGVQRKFTLPMGSSTYLAKTVSVMQPLQTSAVPVAQQASTPSFFSKKKDSSVNTFADCSVLGFVFMDGEGCLRLAPQGSAAPASALSALPMMHVPCGATASSGMPQMQYSPSTMPPQPWRPAAAPVAAPSASLPRTISSELWGNTKAWVFRDGRWISLSI